MTSPLTQRWRETFTQDPEVGAFVRSLQQSDAPARVMSDDEDEFVRSLRPPPPLTLFPGDPAQREKEEVLGATFRLPVETVRMMEPILSDSLTAHAPDWFSQATASWKAGWGDVYVTGARAMEWMGLPASAYEPYRDFGLGLQRAYLPPMNPEEFTWRQLRNPEWYATSVARAVPFSLSLLPATIVGAYAGGASATAIGLGAFGRTVLTFLGGGAFSRTIESAFEAGSSYDEAIQAGLSPDEADARADFVFKHNLTLTGMDAAELAIAFTPLQSVGRYLPDVMKRRVVSTLTRLAGVGALESGEEIYQDVIQKLARGEDVTWDAAMKESAAIGALFGVGLGGAGSVYQALTGRVERGLPRDLAEHYEAEQRAAKSAGATDAEATLSALDALAETPAGKAAIEQVLTDLKDRAEGKDAPVLTAEQMESEIGRAERADEAEATAEPETISDEVVEALAKGETDLQDVFGVASDIAAEEEATPVTTTLVSEETYQQAKARLKEKMGGLHAGIDPTVLAELVTIGAYHVERGARTFAAWSKAMVAQFGKTVEPQLRQVWREVNRYLAGSPLPAGDVKRVIRLTASQQQLAKTIREDAALSAAMKKAEQNARVAYRAGKTDAVEQAKAEFQAILWKAAIKAEAMGVKAGFQWGQHVTKQDLIAAFKDSQKSALETRKQLVAYINEHLPADLRGKYLNAVIQHVTKRKQESILRRVDRLAERRTQQELIAELGELVSHDPKVLLEYQRRLDALLADIDLKKMTEGTRRKLESLKTYADEQGMPSGVSQRLVDAIERLSKAAASDMTVEDLRALRDAAKHLKELGTLKKALKYKYNERLRQVALAKLLASTHNLDPEHKTLKGLFYLHLETLQATRATEVIDGYREGENTKLAKGLNTKEEQAQQRVYLTIESAVQEMVDAGITHLTDEQNLAITLHIRQREGATAAVKTLMRAHGLEVMPELTTEEGRVIDILHRYVNARVDALAALHEERTNTPFVKMEWYGLPLYYEGEQVISPEEVILQSYRRTTQTAQGMVKERKPGVSRMPRTDVLAMFEQAINAQYWYLEMQPELDNIARLVKTKEYVATAGELASNWWANHLDIVARRGWSARASWSPFSAILRTARGHLTTAILGYKLSAILMQPFAIVDAMGYAQSRWGTLAALRIAKHFTHSWVSPKETQAVIAASPALQRRAAGEVAVEEALRSIVRSHSAWATFVRGGLSLMTKADVITAAGVQEGIRVTLEEHGAPNAAREAEYLMKMVSSSADVTLRPHILSWGEGARTWFTFKTFLLNRWGIIIHDMVAKGVGHGNWKAKMTALFGLAIIVAGKIAEDEARAYLYALVNRRERQQRPSWERLMFALPSHIPFFGDLYEGFSGKPTDMPLIKLVSDMFNVANIPRMAKPETQAKAALRGAEATTTLLFGVPGTAQTFDVIEGLFLPDKGARRVTK